MFLNLDKCRLGKSILALVAICGVAATAQAAPVQYSFTTGTPGSSDFGAVDGLFDRAERAFGTFTYHTDVVGGATSLVSGPGMVYGNISNWEGFAGGRRFFDGGAGTLVGDDSGVGGTDLYRVFGTVAGGAWEPFSIGGNTLVQAQISWVETALTGDFLTSNDLLPTLPSFGGILLLVFTNDLTGANGSVQFSNVRVTPTAVPEPGILLLLSMGLPMLLLARRRSNRK